jgi:hypothetical protein
LESGDLKALHLNQTSLTAALDLTKDHAFQVPMENSLEKQRVKKQKNHQQEKNHHENNGQHKQQRRRYARKLLTQETATSPCHSSLRNPSVESSVPDTTAKLGGLLRTTGTNPTSIKYCKVGSVLIQRLEHTDSRVETEEVISHPCPTEDQSCLGTKGPNRREDSIYS